MRVAVKPSHRAYIGTLSQGSEIGAPVVQPMVAKLSLGSTSNSYLTSLAEVSAATAVISSIGQTPPSRLSSEKIHNSEIPATNAEALDSSAVHLPRQEDYQEVFLLDTPSQTIHSLSELSPHAQTLSISASRVVNSDTIQIEGNGSTRFLASQDQTAVTEILSLNNIPTLNTANLLSVGEANPNLGIGLAAANENFNLSGLLTIINLMPVSWVTTLSTNTEVMSALHDSADTQVFEGITVSGQADSIELIVINPFSRAATTSPGGEEDINFANLASNEIGTYVVGQHSIVVIGILVTQTSEAIVL